jgi:hypothetical protein
MNKSKIANACQGGGRQVATHFCPHFISLIPVGNKLDYGLT